MVEKRRRRVAVGKGGARLKACTAQREARELRVHAVEMTWQVALFMSRGTGGSQRAIQTKMTKIPCNKPAW